MIDIDNEKRRIEKIINKIEQSISFRSYMFNERYLHHFFSVQWQKLYEQEKMKSFVLIHEGDDLILHPEWPTFKKSTDNLFGRYKKKKDENDGLLKYYPSEDDGNSGFVDFAIGNYKSPCIGIEITLKYGWSEEEFIYDLIKLLDKRNPFKLVYSINIILRAKGIPKGRRSDEIKKHINMSYEEAIRRLGTNYDSSKEQNFLVIEVSKDQRKKWVLNNNKFTFTKISKTIQP